MTGLFLTSGSIQMNTNINLRTKRWWWPRRVSNGRAACSTTPTGYAHPNMLAGSNSSSGDEIPTSVNDCQGGTFRGAILVDQITPGCTATPPSGLRATECYLPARQPIRRLPSSAGTVQQAMASTPVSFVRTKRLRMGNFVCDNSPVPAGTSGTSGTSGIGGSVGTGGALTTCTAPREHQCHGVVIIAPRAWLLTTKRAWFWKSP